MSNIVEHPKAQELLAAATVEPDDVRACAQRLQRFLESYGPLFQRQEQRDHALLILQGKLSALPRKTAEPIAHQAGVPRKPVQSFLGAGTWADDPLLDQLRAEVR